MKNKRFKTPATIPSKKGKIEKPKLHSKKNLAALFEDQSQRKEKKQKKPKEKNEKEMEEEKVKDEEEKNRFKAVPEFKVTIYFFSWSFLKKKINNNNNISNVKIV